MVRRLAIVALTLPLQSGKKTAGATVQQPAMQFLQQPVMQQQKSQPVIQLQQPVMQQTKPVTYQQPIVTYAQPIVQAVSQ